MRALADGDLDLGTRVTVSDGGVAHPVAWKGIDQRFLSFLCSPGYTRMLLATVAIGECDPSDLLEADSVDGDGRPTSEASCKLFLARAERLGLVGRAGALSVAGPQAVGLCAAASLRPEKVAVHAVAAVAKARAARALGTGRITDRNPWVSVNRLPTTRRGGGAALKQARRLEHRGELSATERGIVDSLSSGAARRSKTLSVEGRIAAMRHDADIEGHFDSYRP